LTKDLPTTFSGLLQKALWSWPDSAELRERLCQDLAAAARAAAGPEGGKSTREVASRLQDVRDMPEGDRRMLLARGLRLVVEGSLDGRAMARQPCAAAERPGTRRAAPLTSLRGCGPKTADRLAERGLVSVEDLAQLLPLGYEDRRVATPIGALHDGKACTTWGEVGTQGWRGRGRRRFYEIQLRDPADGASVLLRWFRTWPGLASRFPRGSWLQASGTPRSWRGRLQMAHPQVARIALGQTPAREGLVPRYPVIGGVPARLLGRLVQQGLDAYLAEQPPEILPPGLLQELGLPGRADALRMLHRPSSNLSDEEVAALQERTSPAHQRLLVERVFVAQVALAKRRRSVRAARALPCPPVDRGAVEACLPFTLTRAQQRVLGQISEDLARAVPMQRLLQGDVGAGKTAVAFGAALQVLRAGGQVALMAPTEILAGQHAETLRPWVEIAGYRLALLTGSTPRGSRETMLSLLGAGDLHLVVGTHALLAERIGWQRLGLAVVDEQHRFGVAQRARLVGAGGDDAARARPHLLVMTATPIPRTLALTVYGDLDVSVVDELPPGRVAPATHVFSARQRDKLYARLLHRLGRGDRAFVVCPLVAESEVLDVASAEQTYEDLVTRLSPHPVGLLHGRMSSEEKAQALRAFRKSDISVLVATTVVEVGVDVPDADIMVVESAERFGLAQLHQLRGRIGRRPDASPLCLLITDEDATPEARRRLQVMAKTSDGFQIAERDLEIRGPGELLGVRQAGGGRQALAGAMANPQLISAARAAARALVQEDPTLARPEHAGLSHAVREIMSAGIFGEEAG